MVQEHNQPPRKTQASDYDSARHPDPLPIPPRASSKGSSPLTDIASGLALLLSIIAFFMSCYAAIQANNNRRPVEPATVLPRSSSIDQPVSRPVIPSLSQSQQVEPGQYLQPTQDRSGEVELLSANRLQQAGRSDLAKIQLRIHRLDRPVSNPTAIDLQNTIALNSRTNEKYTAVQSQTPNDQLITMTNLRPGSTVDASVTVRVPEKLDRIDLDIPNVRVFRNVPIS